MLKNDQSKTEGREYIILLLLYIVILWNLPKPDTWFKTFASSFLDNTMVGEEMSLRKRLSKSSDGPEEKEDQGNPAKQAPETPSNGEAFHLFLRWINEREQI